MGYNLTCTGLLNLYLMKTPYQELIRPISYNLIFAIR
jgi:hypothetical protein